MKKTQLKRKTPLKKSSTKRAKEMALYRKERDVFLRECLCDLERRFCPVVSNEDVFIRDAYGRVIIFREVIEVHHRKGRNGKLLRDQRYWLAVSREGHEFIHRNPRLAREKGWLI